MSDDLDTYLNGLPDKLGVELSKAIKEQAERLSAAQRNALRSTEMPPADTGDLEASCRVVDGENDLECLVQAGGEATTKEVRQGSGVGFDYALAYEYGTSHQHAKPFFWNTYDALRDDMQSKIDDAGGKAINQ